MARYTFLTWAILAWASLNIMPGTAHAFGPVDTSATVIAAPPAGDQLHTDSANISDDAISLGMFDIAMLIAVAVAAAIFIRWRLWKLPSEPNRPQAFTPLVGFALYIAMYLTAVIGGGIALSLFAPADDNAAGNAGAVAYTFQQEVMIQSSAYALQSIVVIVFLTMVLRAAAPKPDNRPCYWRAGLYGAGALLLIWPVVLITGTVAAYVQTLFTAEPIKQIAHDTLRQMLERPADSWLILQAVLVIGFAPILEEVLYRGIFQETLRRLGMSPWWAIGSTSVFFAAMHWSNTEPHAVISLVVLSLGFGWIYEKTGRLTSCIIMHALFNAANLALAMLLQPM